MFKLGKLAPIFARLGRRLRSHDSATLSEDERRQESKHLTDTMHRHQHIPDESELDEALEDTFPASDPISYGR